VLVLLASLALPAAAGRPPTLTVTPHDAAGEPVPTAAVIFDVEDERRSVHAQTGAWQGDTLYPSDGSELVLERGRELTGWVVAPGYEPVRFRVQVRKRKHTLDITLPAMDTRASIVPLPQADDAKDVRRALRIAAAAIQQRDLATASLRLDAADRARIQLEGGPYVDSTLAIMELRTLVALQAWTSRIDHARTDPSDANMHALDVSRGVTADLALDWRNYARSAGRDDSRAVALCRTASGRSSRCD